jgi:hypothetical protein
MGKTQPKRVPLHSIKEYSKAEEQFHALVGWWITCNYPTVLKQKNTQKHKEYNLRYLLAKARTT